MPAIKPLLAGAIMLNAWAIALFFLRFSRKTGDPLFRWFAFAFMLLGIERVSLVWFSLESYWIVYLIRLTGFLLIIFAIWQKNRKKPA
jgi:hypothetical protein